MRVGEVKLALLGQFGPRDQVKIDFDNIGIQMVIEFACGDQEVARCVEIEAT